MILLYTVLLWCIISYVALLFILSRVASAALRHWYVFPKYQSSNSHDDVIKWKHFSRYWPFVRGIHRSPVNSPHKGQWRGALMFSLICVWINSWINNREADDMRPYRAHYDVIRNVKGMGKKKTPVNEKSKTKQSPTICTIHKINIQSC